MVDLVEIDNNGLVKEKKGDMDIKRFYYPKITILCPVCKNVIEKTDDYFFNPPLNEEFEEWIWCPECFYEWKETFFIKLKVEVR